MASILESESRLRKIVDSQGQQHVFRFWDQLSGPQREQLLSELDALDFEEVSRLIQQHIKGNEAEHAVSHPEPSPYIRQPQTDAERQRHREAYECGVQAVREGRAAAFLVAGGQGTRLGYDGPKGCFPIGPISNKTLFQLFAEKILATCRRYDAVVPWYIMTSRDNDEITRRFFEEHDYFGLSRDNIVFFRQGMMPAVDQDGRLLMDSPYSLALTPDGHGGAIRALKRSGALDDMTRRGVAYISHFQVDNVLVQPIDPVFIGFHVQTGSQMSSRMVKKRSPDERVGNFCLVDGRLHVIEYSDMPADLAERRRPDGSLYFEAGNVAIHIYDVDFVSQLNQHGYELPFHRAWKKVPFVNDLSHRIRPRQPNANKFEMFVFDALPAAKKTMILEGARESVFSPVKNARGEDSIDTAQGDMMAEVARWLKAAGMDVATDSKGLPPLKLEVSPLFALDEEGFVDRARERNVQAVTENTYFE
ncbi:MAG: UDPGP type 1 family protein [Planctomycetes bacterium]|nr:UDPGP type 1 family protein [Planctomycetota bacterium]